MLTTAKVKGLLEGFGLGDVELNHEREAFTEVIRGRVAHIDGDFICYHSTCHEDEDWETMIRSALAQIEKLRRMAGAESVCVHLTSKYSDKGKRGVYAIQKEYQGNRKGKPKPKNLERMRLYLAEHYADGYEARYWTTQEADDGMCQAAWAAVQDGKPQLAIIVSPDKDLRQCQGWHMDWNTGEMQEVAGYGKIELDRSKGTTKLIGWGMAYFWAQMLMGDAADNIAGLPCVTADIRRVLLEEDTTKSKKCGPVAAYELLKDCTNTTEACRIVSLAYSSYGETVGFTDYRTGMGVAWEDAMAAEAILLWMRRSPEVEDVFKWIR